MNVLIGDVLDLGENMQAEVEDLKHVEGMGLYIKFKDESTLFSAKRLNVDEYQKCLVRRGQHA